MKKSLLVATAAILLFGIAKKFAGQETSSGYRKLLPGANPVIEQQSMMEKSRFFSMQELHPWQNDQRLPDQHRITTPIGRGDFSGSIMITREMIGQHELSAGVDTAWVQHYASGLYPAYDEAKAIAVDAMGNVYATGSSSSGTFGTDYCTVKYSPSGSILWTARYNGEGNGDNCANAIQVDASGNVYVTGWSSGSGTDRDYATVKYDSKGVQQWVARYNGHGNSNDEAYALVVDDSGNIYVTGSTNSFSDTEPFYFQNTGTIKYNSEGIEQWAALYTQRSSPSALAVDNSGNVYITGVSYDSVGGRNYGTIKYNSVGIEQWLVRYNGPGDSDDWANALAVDGSGNIYVTGWSGGSGTKRDYATIKYDSAGIEQWVARYNGPKNDNDEAQAIAVDVFGNVFVTGWSEGSGTEEDYATVKYNSAGVEQWIARYNNPPDMNDEATALALDAGGNIYVTGMSKFNLATVKYNSEGVEQWVKLYKGHSPALVVAPSGNIYVTGTSYGSATESDYVTIKYNSDGVEQWISPYNGPGNSHDDARGLGIDDAGNVYVTGESRILMDSSDYATIKYNSEGDQQWITRYNGTENIYDEATALAVDASGNIYVTGTSHGYTTVKYNSIGLEQWVARYGGAEDSYERATALAVDAAGNVYVTGESRISQSSSDYATVKYNSDGVEQWVVRYNGPGNDSDFANALAVDAFGNVYVTGESKGSGTTWDYTTIKYNSAGIEQWVARYTGPENVNANEATSLTVDPAGNVYVTGRSEDSVTGSDYATVKYNSEGVQQWVVRHPWTWWWGLETSLAVDASGNVYVIGGGNYSPFTTVKYNSEGVELWSVRYDDPLSFWYIYGSIAARDLSVDAFGNVYVTGTSDLDYVTVKYNSEGVEQWSARYNGPGNARDGAIALKLDASGNVYVTGTSSRSEWWIYTTIKYVQTPVSVEHKETVSPNRYLLAQNYPNPFNSTTVISYQLPVSGQVELSIYNLLGQKIVTLVSEQQSVGIHRFNWDARGLASGVYLYRLEAGGFVQVKKLILMR